MCGLDEKVASASQSNRPLKSRRWGCKTAQDKKLCAWTVLHPQRPAIVDHQSPLKNDVDLEGESWIGLPYLHPIRGYFYQGSCLTEHVEQQHERHAASQLTWSGVVSAPVAPLLALPSQEAEAACCGGRAKSGATCGCGCGCLWWQSVPGTPLIGSTRRLGEPIRGFPATAARVWETKWQVTLMLYMKQKHCLMYTTSAICMLAHRIQCLSRCHATVESSQ